MLDGVLYFVLGKNKKLNSCFLEDSGVPYKGWLV